MNLVIISGFLGSGKTTLLLALARCFSDQGRTLAVIENEVGTIGVDDASLREEGLTVREIYSGCICCSLRMDLVSALLEIERDYSPDVVILEPSGVAGPKQVLNALTGYGGEIESKRLLSVVDASRFEAIQDMSIPLVTDGIDVADIVLINKTDLLSAPHVQDIITVVRGVKEEAFIVPVSALTGEGMDDVLEALNMSESRRSEIEIGPKTGPTPTVYTQTIAISAALAVPELGTYWCERMDAIGASLRSSGCDLIGHIKGILKSDKGGYLVISKTDFSYPAQVKGRLPSSFNDLSLTLNIIVYGISIDVLTHLVSDALNDKNP